MRGRCGSLTPQNKRELAARPFTGSYRRSGFYPSAWWVSTKHRGRVRASPGRSRAASAAESCSSWQLCLWCLQTQSKGLKGASPIAFSFCFFKKLASSSFSILSPRPRLGLLVYRRGEEELCRVVFGEGAGPSRYVVIVAPKPIDWISVRVQEMARNQLRCHVIKASVRVSFLCTLKGRIFNIIVDTRRSPSLRSCLIAPRHAAFLQLM